MNGCRQWCMGLLGALAASVAVATAACSRPAPAGAGAPPAPDEVAVQVVKVEIGQVERVLEISGSLAARERVGVTSKLPGTLERVAVQRGDHVTVGQTRATLDRRDRDAKTAAAQAAVGVARAALERTHEILKRAGVLTADERTPWVASAAEAELARLEADVDVARLLTLKAAWMADNRVPNSTEASMAKAKAGRVATETTLRCVELCGPCGYDQTELLEKWARDAKILDIFEGTQQIQMLVVARRLLGKTSGELR
jgi:multidrug efflux pump subunit AcrA (membrane-fusion protein)